MSNEIEELMNNPVKVKIDTSMGDIIIELDTKKAPISCENFLHYVMEDYYNGTLFHRVIDGFMIQGGGLLPDMSSKETGDPITNEADNGLKNNVGTLALARTGDPHSATSQFFINVAKNDFLNHRSKSPEGWGYAVFGRVVEGMNVVDSIKGVDTMTKNFHENVPVIDIYINKMEIVNE